MKNRMFRRVVMLFSIMLLFSVILSYPQNLYAHAPQDVKLSYDSGSQILTVTITHKSAAKGVHYIKYVEIRKNGTVISKNTYDNQPAPETFTYTYKLSAAENDMVDVTATCSLWGHKTATLTITKQ